MRTLPRNRLDVPICLAPTEVRCAKIPAGKMLPLTGANPATTAEVAPFRVVLMMTFRQMVLRPRPRGLDLAPRSELASQLQKQVGALRTAKDRCRAQEAFGRPYAYMVPLNSDKNAWCEQALPVS